ncbi:hypothetical protein TNCV_4949051 [Trichonephila clavipes]|nr:hypothetical protein TNCV_4949051 [Trichonephila clavipes]
MKKHFELEEKKNQKSARDPRRMFRVGWKLAALPHTLGDPKKLLVIRKATDVEKEVSLDNSRLRVIKKSIDD